MVDNKPGFIQAIDKKLWGNELQSGAIGDQDSIARTAASKGLHSLNCAANAVKETGTSLWNQKTDYTATKREADIVVGNKDS